MLNDESIRFTGQTNYKWQNGGHFEFVLQCIKRGLKEAYDEISTEWCRQHLANVCENTLINSHQVAPPFLTSAEVCALLSISS